MVYICHFGLLSFSRVAVLVETFCQGVFFFFFFLIKFKTIISVPVRTRVCLKITNLTITRSDDI